MASSRAHELRLDRRQARRVVINVLPQRRGLLRDHLADPIMCLANMVLSSKCIRAFKSSDPDDSAPERPADVSVAAFGCPAGM